MTFLTVIINKIVFSTLNKTLKNIKGDSKKKHFNSDLINNYPTVFIITFEKQKFRLKSWFFKIPFSKLVDHFK